VRRARRGEVQISCQRASLRRAWSLTWLFRPFIPLIGLSNQVIGAFILMHSKEVLFEVVEPRPFLLPLFTGGRKAFVHPALTMRWLHLMNSLLVSFEIVDGCKSLCRSCTVRLIANVFSLMSSSVLSGSNGQSWRASQHSTTHLKSDMVLQVNVQPGTGQLWGSSCPALVCCWSGELLI